MTECLSGKKKKRRGRSEKDCKLKQILHRKGSARRIWVKTSESTSLVHACTDAHTLGANADNLLGAEWTKGKTGYVTEKLQYSSGSLRTFVLERKSEKVM